jgi:hypothetical protein
MLLLGLALLVALAAGLGAAWLSSRVRGVYFDGQALSESVGLPLLGVVTLLRSQAVQLREKVDLRRFAAAVGSLVAAYAAAMVALTLLASRAVAP